MDDLTDTGYCQDLIGVLRMEPRESEWLEFKESKFEAEATGKYLSALANGAALKGKRFGYIVWGVRDKDHTIVGTKIRLAEVRVGNEPFVNWINGRIKPPVEIEVGTVSIDGHRVEILRVERAIGNPIKFNGTAYIRVGDRLQPLAAQEARERELWRALHSTSFEDLIAAERLTEAEVLRLLDATAFASMLGEQKPVSRSRLIELLAAEQLIVRGEAGGWNITNLGVMLAASDMREFVTMARKPLRIIEYVDNARVQTQDEQLISTGYAVGFEQIVTQLTYLTRGAEQINGDGIRRQPSKYPLIALRELVANLLIHQDFAVRGAGPTVEVFVDRVEFTNPGLPLIETVRFLDSPPQSRNERLAGLMRRIGICEERGSGVDKVIAEVEAQQLPAPKFETRVQSTIATLFVRRDLLTLDTEERTLAVYLHTSLRYINHQSVNNASVRTRFGLSDSDNAVASRLLRECVDRGLIKIADPDAGTKNRRYHPFWA